MWLKRILKYLVLLVVLFLVGISMFVGAVYLGVFGPLPDKADLIEITNEEASLVLAADGTLIGKFFAENRTNIKWEDLPENLVNALIATEDKRFFEHKGIDGRSYLRVLFKTILMGDKSSGGGSTITQQLVKNLYGRGDHSFLSLPVSKTREAIIAYRMEQVLSKEDILLLYLNSVPFGEEVFGVEAASKRYFDKHASELHTEESAVLVGILKANTYYNPRLNPENAIQRRNQVLALMAGNGFLTSAQAERLQDLPLDLHYTNYQLESPAGYFVYQVKQRAETILEDLRDDDDIPYDLRKDGLKIYTTLDFQLQKIANRAAGKQLRRMQPMLDRELSRFGVRKQWEQELRRAGVLKNVGEHKHKIEVLTLDGMTTAEMTTVDSLWHYYKMLNAAVLAADPITGAVYAWAGGNNFRYLPYDLVLAERQVASTIKPLLYAAAIEEGFQPCDYFDNKLKEYKKYEGWKPENYDKSHSDKMKVAMWYALSRSLNLPTVDLYFQTGHEEVADLMRRLGLEVPFEETPSIALGAVDASLMQMVLAYSAFANGGFLHDDLIMIQKITDADGNVIYEKKAVGQALVMDPSVSAEITQLLEIAVDEGTGVKMRTGYGVRADLAGKTGTAQNYSDAWFIAYTPRLVLGTWVGARSPQMHFRSGLGSGSALALPISGSIFSDVQSDADLSRKYLIAFPADTTLADVTCEPFREKGLSGLINRMKKEKPETLEEDPETEAEEVIEEEKEKSKFRQFFNNLFKKKDKKEEKKKKKDR